MQDMREDHAMSVLYWHEAGPRISYGNEMFVVEDLNPENLIRFRMTAEEMRGLAQDILRNLPPEKSTGMWPDWGDSPNGFDGPGGAN
jgi:hypothetical protein